MKKMMSLLLALCMMLPMAAMAASITLGQVLYAPHGTRSFAVMTVAMEGDTIVAAHIDEFQFLDASAIGVPNSDAGFGEAYPEGKVLASKRVNTAAYSKSMAAAGSTVALDVNFDAIQKFVVGKTVAELEAFLKDKTKEDVVDAVSGATLVDTRGYIEGLIAAARAAQ